MADPAQERPWRRRDSVSPWVSAPSKNILQRQLRDIGVQRRQVQRRGGIARRAEHVRSALKQLAAPPGDLVGMQFVLLGHFSGPCVVWDLLSDPRAVVGCVPGAALGEEHEDGTFDGTLTVKSGPTKVTFRARIELALDKAAMAGSVSARGKDNQGGTRFRATMSFKATEQTEPPGSKILIEGENEIPGKLAGLVESGAKITQHE